MDDLRREVLTTWGNLRAVARRFVEASAPLAAKIAFDEDYHHILARPHQPRGMLLELLAQFDQFVTKLSDQEKLMGDFTRRELAEAALLHFQRCKDLESRLNAKLSTRLDRVRKRCEAVHALVVEKQLSTATAADWRAIHDFLMHYRTDLLLKRRLPRGAALDAMSPEQLGYFYLGVQSLRKQYRKWLANRPAD